MTRYGPTNASPEAGPKVPTPGGHIVSPRRVIYTCDYETNKVLSVFVAGLDRTSGAPPHQAPQVVTLRKHRSLRTP
jgi:hypothetical protein